VLLRLLLTRLILIPDKELKIVEMQLAIAKKWREVSWSRAARMRWLNDTGIEMFTFKFFATSGADGPYRYNTGC
jgi:hypothetical protein